MNEQSLELPQRNGCIRFFKATAKVLKVNDDKSQILMMVTSGITFAAVAFVAMFSMLGACDEKHSDHVGEKIALTIVGPLINTVSPYGIFASAYNFGQFLYRRGGAGKFIGTMLALAGFILSATATLACQIAFVILNARTKGQYAGPGDLCYYKENPSLYFLDSYISTLILSAVILANGICGAITGYVVERKNAPDSQPLLNENQMNYGANI